MLMPAIASNDSITGGRTSVATKPATGAKALTAAQTVQQDPVLPPTTRPTEACATADAAIQKMQWWMGLAVVAIGVTVGLLVSRGAK